MSEYQLDFTGPDNVQRSLKVASGQILFVLGANGTGKSTLMQVFASQNIGQVRRLTAHRQVWFSSDTIDITPQGRQSTETQISHADTQEQSCWRDDIAAARSQAIIFDLINSENVEARDIADAARAGYMDLVKQLASTPSPIAKMNDILHVSNLRFRIEVKEGSSLTAVRDGVEPYSIAHLSDGERNALLTAANVLTAPNDTLILIDEPERHLHRSIVSPLITTLLAHRADCAFVVSTHDVALPIDQPECSALLLRRFVHNPHQWTADFIEHVEELDDRTAQAVLGARRLLLFVEGQASSLDLQLYQVLFPTVSIRPLGSCVEVERAVRGLRAAGDCHWLTAIGVVDRDNRSDEECKEMMSCGVVPLEQYSVESLYYHPDTVQGVSSRVSDVSGANSSDALLAARGHLVEAVTANASRLAARVVERRVRDELLKQAPDWRDIATSSASVKFDGADFYETEKGMIRELADARDVARLVSRYPIRETPGPTNVAKVLGFQSRHLYEQAVRKMLADSEEARARMLTLIQPLADAIAHGGVTT